MANLVVHFEIHASEPQKLVDFYTQLFGWTFTNYGGGDQPYWVIDTGEGAIGNVAGQPGLGINGGLTQRMGPRPEVGAPVTGISVSIAFGGITAFLVRLAVKARRHKSRLGVDALIGLHASAMEPLTPEGHVLVDGEIWRAVASEMVPAGTSVQVVGHEQYLLRVIPLAPSDAASLMPNP